MQVSSKNSPWRPPTRKTVSSTLLDAEVEDVGARVVKLTDGKKSIFGGALQRDGWTEPQASQWSGAASSGATPLATPRT
ncbi:unnamed protein product [Discosporangium mesarthrocarpum]